jgi:hypothetical protein
VDGLSPTERTQLTASLVAEVRASRFGVELPGHGSHRCSTHRCVALRDDADWEIVGLVYVVINPRSGRGAT